MSSPLRWRSAGAGRPDPPADDEYILYTYEEEGEEEEARARDEVTGAAGT